MPLVEALSMISAVAPIAQPVIEWGIKYGEGRTTKRLEIAKAFHHYRAELKENNAILERINLDAIDTKDIANPAIKSLANRLKTKAADNLLLSLLSQIQNPQKAVKALPLKEKKTDEKEAKKIIKAIIFVLEKTKELQCFTTLTEAERRILKGFYVRARLKHIKEKTLFIKQRL